LTPLELFAPSLKGGTQRRGSPQQIARLDPAVIVNATALFRQRGRGPAFGFWGKRLPRGCRSPCPPRGRRDWAGSERGVAQPILGDACRVARGGWGRSFGGVVSFKQPGKGTRPWQLQAVSHTAADAARLELSLRIGCAFCTSCAVAGRCGKVHWGRAVDLTRQGLEHGPCAWVRCAGVCAK